MDGHYVTAIPAADLHIYPPFVYNAHKFVELRTENAGIDGMDLQDL